MSSLQSSASSASRAVSRCSSLVAGLCLALGAATAHAQAWPAKPIRLVIPFSAGATSDVLARIVMAPLEKSLGQSIVIDNKPGAGGMLGAAEVARAAPDGHVLAWGTVSNHAIAPNLYAKPLYDPLKDFTPVSLLLSVPHVVMVHPEVPARSLGELVALARARPGALRYASSGNGTISHLIGELFKSRAGVDLVHVPYKSSAQGLPDHLAGRIEVMFDTIVVSQGPISQGRSRALAVTGAKRIAALPEIPTVAETGLPGFEASGWFGIYAPAGTPAALVDRLSEALRRALGEPDTLAHLREQGAEAIGSTAAQFEAHMRTEVPKWAALIRAIGAKVD